MTKIAIIIHAMGEKAVLTAVSQDGDSKIGSFETLTK